MAAVQIAKGMSISGLPRFLTHRAMSYSALGCKVIATASTEDKRQICKEKGGADYTIGYTKTGWQVSFSSILIICLDVNWPCSKKY